MGMQISTQQSKHEQVVFDYHERTKHRLDRPAASLGYMDWANQPDPFRTFTGAEQIRLPFPALRQTPAYGDLFSRPPAAAPIDADSIGRFFYHSLALSAWKQAPYTQPWSLRINPSSGDLHPTEGYLASGPVPGLLDSAGIFHYAPYSHRLERRCDLSARQWARLTDGLPAPCLLVGLSSIHWRESWKYGERAFRYCHLDVGHVIGAAAISARTLGWEARLAGTIADDDLNRLLGTHLQRGIEAEHADCLLVLYPAGAKSDPRAVSSISCGQWRERIPEAVFTGSPNRLSRDHQQWPVIEKVSQATRKPSSAAAGSEPFSSAAGSPTPGLVVERQLPAERIIRQRRSAVDMDSRTSLARPVFYQMLQSVLPGQFPFAALPWHPTVSLAIFVHRVEGLLPGLYLLARTKDHETQLRQSLQADFQWRPADGSPRGLRVHRLLTDDTRRMAKVISCNQAIAADGAFSLGMVARFDAVLTPGNAWRYPRLFWECGLIGQVLYLEAEAANLRATGIGCFFDDVMHDLLGITDRSWQSLYHFTVGVPVDDHRLKTMAPYAHLQKG